jgi:FkbM family methyltransferase
MSRLLTAKKALHGLTSPLAFRGLRLGVGAAIEHGWVLSWLAPELVVDVGANRGQFSLATRLRLPNARIIAFEPLRRPRAIYERLFRDDPKVRCEPFAVGSEDARREMVVTAEDDSSSLFAPAETQMALFGTRVASCEAVEVRRLTEVIEPDALEAPALLKIDVQGFELEVLLGAGDLLPRFRAVYVEASFLPLYAGQPLASEVISLLIGAGFEARGAFNQTWSAKYGPVQADLLFVHPDAAFQTASEGSSPPRASGGLP